MLREVVGESEPRDDNLPHRVPGGTFSMRRYFSGDRRRLYFVSLAASRRSPKRRPAATPSPATCRPPGHRGQADRVTGRSRHRGKAQALKGILPPEKGPQKLRPQGTVDARRQAEHPKVHARGDWDQSSIKSGPQYGSRWRYHNLGVSLTVSERVGIVNFGKQRSLRDRRGRTPSNRTIGASLVETTYVDATSRRSPAAKGPAARER